MNCSSESRKGERKGRRQGGRGEKRKSKEEPSETLLSPFPAMQAEFSVLRVPLKFPEGGEETPRCLWL